MTRPVVHVPIVGQVITLGDLLEFVAAAKQAGYPDAAQPRVVGDLTAFDMVNGPRIARITLRREDIPEQVPDA